MWYPVCQYGSATCRMVRCSQCGFEPDVRSTIQFHRKDPRTYEAKGIKTGRKITTRGNN